MTVTAERRHGPPLGRVARAVAVLAALSVVGSVGPASAQAGRPRIEVVNLGDSFSAAVGTGGVAPVPPLGCYQGQGLDHVSRLDARPHVEVLLDAACAGATTSDVRAVLAQPVVAAALARADLVTLTLGGNDVGWTQYLRACSRAGEAAAPGVCDALLAQVDTRTAAAAASARTTVAALDAATDGEVVVLGYPRLVEPTVDSPLVSAARAAQLGAATDRLDAALRQAATAEGARFADVRDRFAGHGVGSAEPWIFLDPTDLTRPDTLHPTSQGYLRGYYPALLGAVALGRLGRG